MMDLMMHDTSTSNDSNQLSTRRTRRRTYNNDITAAAAAASAVSAIAADTGAAAVSTSSSTLSIDQQTAHARVGDANSQAAAAAGPSSYSTGTHSKKRKRTLMLDSSDDDGDDDNNDALRSREGKTAHPTPMVSKEKKKKIASALSSDDDDDDAAKPSKKKKRKRRKNYKWSDERRTQFIEVMRGWAKKNGASASRKKQNWEKIYRTYCAHMVARGDKGALPTSARVLTNQFNELKRLFNAYEFLSQTSGVGANGVQPDEVIADKIQKNPTVALFVDRDTQPFTIIPFKFYDLMKEMDAKDTATMADCLDVVQLMKQYDMSGDDSVGDVADDDNAAAAAAMSSPGSAAQPTVSRRRASTPAPTRKRTRPPSPAVALAAAVKSAAELSARATSDAINTLVRATKDEAEAVFRKAVYPTIFAMFDESNVGHEDKWFSFIDDLTRNDISKLLALPPALQHVRDKIIRTRLEEFCKSQAPPDQQEHVDSDSDSLSEGDIVVD
jgi:hypothetical protein